jgi:hypothetical protein
MTSTDSTKDVDHRENKDDLVQFLDQECIHLQANVFDHKKERMPAKRPVT